MTEANWHSGAGSFNSRQIKGDIITLIGIRGVR